MLVLDGDARATVVIGSTSLVIAIGLVGLLVRRRTWPATSDTASELDRWVAAALLSGLASWIFVRAGRSGVGTDELSELLLWVIVVMFSLGAVGTLMRRRPPPSTRRGWATTVALTAGMACLVCCALRSTSIPFEVRLAMSRSDMDTVAHDLWEESDGPRRHYYLMDVPIDRLGDFEITGVGTTDGCPEDAGLLFRTRGGGSFVWCDFGEAVSHDLHFDVRPLGGRWWLSYEPFD